MPKYTQAENRQWFNDLPKKQASSATIFRNSLGQILLVKPNYRDDWILPGGTIDENESPLAAAIREIKEELDLEIMANRLQLRVINYIHASEGFNDSYRFLFDGGVLDDASIESIHLQPSELESMQFADVGQSMNLIQQRLGLALNMALSAQHCLYLEDGQPV
jgi:8-oxo-dGTP diphosphatase